MHSKISSEKYQPFCSGYNMLGTPYADLYSCASNDDSDNGDDDNSDDKDDNYATTANYYRLRL